MYCDTNTSDTIIRVIEQVRETLKLSDEDFQYMLGRPAKSWKQTFRTLDKAAYQHLEGFAYHTGTEPIAIATDSVRYNKLRIDIKMSHYKLPPKYKSLTRSKMRSAHSIFKYLEDHRPHLVSGIQRKVGLPYYTTTDPDEPVSVSLILDIFKTMSEKGMKPIDFQEVGQVNAREFRECAPFYAAVTTDIKTPRDLYENFFDVCIKFLDGTWNYKLQKVTDTSCTVRIRTNPEAQDHFKSKQLKSTEICEYRKGLAQELLKYIMDFPGVVEETKCVSQGDPYCQFELLYPPMCLRKRS